jgi:hypothetical protein
MISRVGIEPFLEPESGSSFGSYNILKEEFISLEYALPGTEINQINVVSGLLMMKLLIIAYLAIL